MRPDLVDKYAAAGRDADDGRAHGATESRERTAFSRASRPIPASAGRRSPRERGPGTHGSTNNTFHEQRTRLHDRLDELRRNGSPPGGHDRSGGRARREVRGIDGVGRRAELRARRCRVLSSTSARSSRRRGVLVNYDLPGQPAGRECVRRLVPAHGVSRQPERPACHTGYDVPAVTDASGWTNVPATQGTPKQTQFRLRSTSCSNVTRFFDLFIYDTAGSATGYDHVLVVPSTNATQERRRTRSRTSHRATGRTSRSP